MLKPIQRTLKKLSTLWKNKLTEKGTLLPQKGLLALTTSSYHHLAK
jgi:hypothetical protein